MRYRAAGVAVAALVAACCAVPAAHAAPARAGEMHLAGMATGAVIPNSWIVTLRSGDPDRVAAEHARWGVHVGQVLHSALRGYTGRMNAALARRVAADPRVRTVEQDRVVRATSDWPSPGVSAPSAQSIPTGVARVGAPASSTKAGDGHGTVDADIAVLDTGIDAGHPDLNVAGGTDCVPGTTSWDDERGHGTNIAGIAAAKDNDFGVVGVAPGARVWAVRVLDAAGDGSLATLTCGIDWVTAHAAIIDVANMSLIGIDPGDGNCLDGGLHQAICTSVAAGVTYTVAAGNDAADASSYSPASYPEVITVGAIADYDGRGGGLADTPSGCDGGGDDEFATFSNYGSVVDILAPGVCIRSTWLNGGYATLTGTSQAAAHVAGAAALYRSQHPGAGPAAVREALREAASSNYDLSTDPDDVPIRLLDVADF
ncbi:MAG TPA: S8 family serine peptidase [Sporichthyaceae bacterium]|nr:S8 family serine peptidase [Sporichthyaceae bacterium]